jgi:hypothetical protein
MPTCNRQVHNVDTPLGIALNACEKLPSCRRQQQNMAAAASHRHQEQLREPGATATDTITLPESSSTDDSVVGTASSHGIDAASTAAAAVPEFLPPMGESLRLEVEQRIRDHALNQVSCLKNLVYLEATSCMKLLPPPKKRGGATMGVFTDTSLSSHQYFFSSGLLHFYIYLLSFIYFPFPPTVKQNERFAATASIAGLVSCRPTV